MYYFGLKSCIKLQSLCHKAQQSNVFVKKKQSNVFVKKNREGSGERDREMGEVVINIDETKSSKKRISRCRICHEEEAESFFEVPCACSGTVKFAHRDCIQRWCNEKGNTTCEICLQVLLSFSFTSLQSTIFPISYFFL